MGGHSFITCSAAEISQNIKNWKVLKQEALTKQRYIRFEIIRINTEEAIGRRPTKALLSEKKFREALLEKASNVSYDDLSYGRGNRIVQEAYNKATISERNKKRRTEPYWWTEEISKKRRECIRMRREVTRTNKKKLENKDTIAGYAALKKELKKLTQKSKKEKWLKTCNKVENDV